MREQADVVVRLRRQYDAGTQDVEHHAFPCRHRLRPAFHLRLRRAGGRRRRRAQGQFFGNVNQRSREKTEGEVGREDRRETYSISRVGGTLLWQTDLRGIEPSSSDTGEKEKKSRSAWLPAQGKEASSKRAQKKKESAPSTPRTSPQATSQQWSMSALNVGISWVLMAGSLWQSSGRLLHFHDRGTTTWSLHSSQPSPFIPVW